MNYKIKKEYMGHPIELTPEIFIICRTSYNWEIVEDKLKQYFLKIADHTWIKISKAKVNTYFEPV